MAATNQAAAREALDGYAYRAFDLSMIDDRDVWAAALATVKRYGDEARKLDAAALMSNFVPGSNLKREAHGS